MTFCAIYRGHYSFIKYCKLYYNNTKLFISQLRLQLRSQETELQIRICETQQA